LNREQQQNAFHKVLVMTNRGLHVGCMHTRAFHQCLVVQASFPPGTHMPVVPSPSQRLVTATAPTPLPYHISHSPSTPLTHGPIEAEPPGHAHLLCLLPLSACLVVLRLKITRHHLVLCDDTGGTTRGVGGWGGGSRKVVSTGHSDACQLMVLLQQGEGLTFLYEGVRGQHHMYCWGVWWCG
jgi:hypothetical protein